MKDEWKRVKLSNYATVSSSKRIYASEYVDLGIPFYRGKEIVEGVSSSHLNSLFISQERFNKIKTTYGVPLKGDILLTSVGTLGIPYYVLGDHDFYFKDGNLTWFRKFNGLDSKWFYYWIQSHEGKYELKKCEIGSSQKAYTIKKLSGIEFPNIREDYQSQIANIVSKYDDLIENNQSRIKILEEMAQRLYSEWFVKFKFPGHENVKMVDSGTEFGIIPEGWDVRTIGSILGPVRRKQLIKKSAYLSEGKYPIVDQGKDLISGRTNDEESIINEELIVFGDHTRCFKYCNFKFARGADGTQILNSRDKKRMPNILLFFMAKNSGLKNYQYARHFKFLKVIKLIIPKQEIAEGFDREVSKYYSLISIIRERNEQLIKIRDLLIENIVTGKRLLK